MTTDLIATRITWLPAGSLEKKSSGVSREKMINFEIRLTSLCSDFVENTVPTLTTTNDVLGLESIVHAALTTEINHLGGMEYVKYSLER